MYAQPEAHEHETLLERVGLDRVQPGYLIFGSVCCCLVCVTAPIVISLGTVVPLTYGIRYNVFNKYADVETVYSPGRFFIGPVSVFKTFPATVRTIEFAGSSLAPSGVRYPSLHTRTKEGLALNLQISLQYQLIPEKIGLLYAEFNMDYEDVFTATVRDTLIRTAANYKAVHLWEERESVSQAMQQEVSKVLEPMYATCFSLQLLVIDLPDSFEDSIVRMQVQNQQITTETHMQKTARVRAETEVIKATYSKKAKIVLAGGTANYTLLTKKASAKAKQQVIDMEASVLKQVGTRLNIDSAALLSYQQYYGVSLMRNASMYFGFGENTQVLMAPRLDTFSRRLTNDDDSESPKSSASRKLIAEEMINRDHDPVEHRHRTQEL
eukprot:TRINITY_DN3466_c0_g1_i1.p1 TRINITY_DN3466_c0_g1~~TRINITY_DN3466_c0_g1_i1.p1  ORF type:complete len:381 (-),score=62.27 TRINITY_DN3466_c0_g1_i1:100-1242(-)